MNAASTNHTTTTFPLYTVGPATSSALHTLVTTTPVLSTLLPSPTVLGAHTGNGATLAKYILSHYNTLHSQTIYTHYEAPRLPFIPLVGPASSRRLSRSDASLSKLPLLFLVGEQRRDIIPKTLTDPSLSDDARIAVDEVEVYGTDVMESFADNFRHVTRRLTQHQQQNTAALPHSDAKAKAQTIVIVVFSPQGCEAMLRNIGYTDENGKPSLRASPGTTTSASQQASAGDTASECVTTPSPLFPPPPHPDSPTYILATIGPTTRDFLQSNFGISPDICARKPSPEGVGEAILEFLQTNQRTLSSLSSSGTMIS